MQWRQRQQMKLIKLEINNFRQFYEKQCIDFSVDPIKNVTLIHGENNGGKTAILNALRWCLYNETTANLQNPQNLINKHALAEGKDSFSVRIRLEHNNQLFEVLRTGEHSKRSNRLRVFEILDGCYKENAEKQPNSLINSFLPKEMSQYFFYQGEGTGTLNSQNNFSHIKTAIEEVLGLTIAQRTLSHLDTIKSTYQKDFLSYNTDKELESALANKEVLTSKQAKYKDSLNKKIELCAQANKEYEEQIKQLSRFDKTSIETQINLRAKTELLLGRNQSQLFELKNKKERFLAVWLNHCYGRKLGNIDLSSINTEELNLSHKYHVDKQLLQAILDNHECICGAGLSEDSSSARIISALKESAVDASLKKRWCRATELHDKLKSYTSPLNEMLRVNDDIDDTNDAIIELEKEIQELSQTIETSKIDDIEKIEKKRNSAKRQTDELNKEISTLERELNKIAIDLKETENRIHRLSASLPKAQKLNRLVKATDEIIKLYEEAIRSSKKGVDSILLKKIQALFSRVAFNGYTVKKDSTGPGDSFTWVIVDKDGKTVSAGNGYQAMLAISFVIALIQFSKERSNTKQHLLTPGTVAPFIADSILAFIGPDNGRELMRYIAESVDQSIFMFSQAQWTETHTDKGIRDKIGKEYNLVQHTVLTEDEFKGSYPTCLSIQGNKVDVVRFGSDFDKVTIEEIVLND